MAKGCMHYRLDVDEGNGWKSVEFFRETVADAEKRYNRLCSAAHPEISVRLVECRVLKQKNGDRPQKSS